MKLFIIIFYIAVSALSIIKFDFGVIETAIAIFNIVCFYLYFKKRNLKDNFAMLMLWGYIFLSSTVVAAFEYQTIGFGGGVTFGYNDFRELSIFSNHIILCISIPWLLFNLKQDKWYNKRMHFTGGRPIPKSVIVGFLILAYALSFLSKALGMSDVAESAVILPFRLNGIIDEYRRFFFPFIFAIYIYDCVIKNKKISKGIILAYFLWAILEMLVRISKGAFLSSFLPALIMFFISGKFNKKTATTVFLPVFVVFMVFYPVIENIRNMGDNSAASYEQAFKMSQNKNNETSSPFLRAFINGMDYMKVKDEVDKDGALFSFRRAPLLYAMGGAPTYITRIIDNTPSWSHHSSGATGIVDPLLWGGYGLCYIFMVLFSLICFVVDNNKLFRNNLLYQLIALMFLKTFIMARCISFFIDPMFIASSVTIIIEIIVSRYYYKNYSSNVQPKTISNKRN